MTAARQVGMHKKNSCTRKQAYPTWEEAEKACLTLRQAKNYRPSPGGLLAYRCIYDENHWHIGNSGAKARYRAARVRRLLSHASVPLPDARDDVSRQPAGTLTVTASRER